MTVNEPREDDSRGRHTTTHRQLIMLASDAMIIDTLGMREPDMWDVSVGFCSAFTDVNAVLARGSKFSDCHHQTESGCAVRTEIAVGELSAERWDSYLTLKHEAKYRDDKIGSLREKQQQSKPIARRPKQT